MHLRCVTTTAMCSKMAPHRRAGLHVMTSWWLTQWFCPGHIGSWVASCLLGEGDPDDSQIGIILHLSLAGLDFSFFLSGASAICWHPPHMGLGESAKADFLQSRLVNCPGCCMVLLWLLQYFCVVVQKMPLFCSKIIFYFNNIRLLQR